MNHINIRKLLTEIWKYWKRSPWYDISIVMLQTLTFLSLSRVALILWQFKRVIDAGSLFKIFLYGLRMDLIIVCMISAVPLVIATFINRKGIAGIIWQKTASTWFFIFSFFLLFMEIITPVFISQYDTRPNRLFFEYLEYPDEVFKMLTRGFAFEITIILISSALTLYFMVKINKNTFKKRSDWNMLSRLFFLPVTAGLIFIGARSSLTHRPANPSSVAFTSDSLINTLPLSSAYSLLYSVYRMKDEKNASLLYGSIDEKTMLKTVKECSCSPSGFSDDNIPTLNRLIPFIKRDKPVNLVIILEESLGAEFVGSLGGKNLTPNLEKLTEKGIYFKNLYATGTRSVRGIEAVVTGFFPSPSRSVVKLGKARKDFFTIASFLKKKNYKSRFIYGGNANFDNMASFFLGNGFDEVIQEEDFDRYKFKGSWGVSDEDLFDKTHNILLKDKKPTFTLVFTSSNHTPFEFPDGRITPYNTPKNTVENAVKYADYSLGSFFKKAEKCSYFNNTVFLVVADHNSRVYGNELVPVNRFHIPALIIAPDIKPHIYSKVSSQTDLPVTVLSLMGIEGMTPMIGRNLLMLGDSVPGRAVMQFHKNQAYMEGKHVIILQPGSIYKQFYYADEKLSEESVDEKILKKALSHAQWVSWTYNRKLYKTR